MSVGVCDNIGVMGNRMNQGELHQDNCRRLAWLQGVELTAVSKGMAGVVILCREQGIERVLNIEPVLEKGVGDYLALYFRMNTIPGGLREGEPVAIDPGWRIEEGRIHETPGTLGPIQLLCLVLHDGEKRRQLLIRFTGIDEPCFELMWDESVPDNYQPMVCADTAQLEPLFSPQLYRQALLIAAMAHGEQTTPHGYPYLLHVTGVAAEVNAALSVSGMTFDEANLALQCALLHDVLEDTPVSEGELRHFHHLDKTVVSGVKALTKDKSLPDKSAQMSDSLDRLALLPQAVQMVKLADRIVNLGPPPAYWNRTKISAYRDEAVAILDALGGANQHLAQRLQQKIDEYQRNIDAASPYFVFFSDLPCEGKRACLVFDKNTRWYLARVRAFMKLNDYLYSRHGLRFFKQAHADSDAVNRDQEGLVKIRQNFEPVPLEWACSEWLNQPPLMDDPEIASLRAAIPTDWDWVEQYMAEHGEPDEEGPFPGDSIY